MVFAIRLVNPFTAVSLDVVAVQAAVDMILLYSLPNTKFLRTMDTFFGNWKKNSSDINVNNTQVIKYLSWRVFKKVRKFIFSYLPSRRFSNRHWSNRRWWSWRFLNRHNFIFFFLFILFWFIEAHASIVFLRDLSEQVWTHSSRIQNVDLSKSFHILNISIMKSLLRWSKSERFDYLESFIVLLLELNQMLFSNFINVPRSLNVQVSNFSLNIELLLM